MSILGRLSSQVGDRTEGSNKAVALECLRERSLLAEIVEGLASTSPALAGDCAEVLASVAEQRPEWVSPYAEALTAHIGHRNTRVRWEAIQALALVAESAPAAVGGSLPRLGEIIRRDRSVIVRDYATDAVGNYAATGMSAAQDAYPLLREAVVAWEGKHAGHALNGLAKVAALVPTLNAELRTVAEDYACSSRPVVRKAAARLLRALDPTSQRP